MPIPTWKIIVVIIVAIVGSLIAWGGYSAWYGSQEQWHDTGKVSWVSQEYFVTDWPVSHWAINFTVTTFHHGNVYFTTDSTCASKSRDNYNCTSHFVPVGLTPHLGDLVAVVLHRDNSTDLIFA
jgi:hypothetical protein